MRPYRDKTHKSLMVTIDLTRFYFIAYKSVAILNHS
jgi:hypothetical protein